MGRTRAGIYETETTEQVDENGELKFRKTFRKAKLEPEPDYVKMYIKDIANLHELSNASKNILNQLVANMNYSNEIALIGPIKKKVIKDSNVKEVTLEKALTELIAHGIIKRISRGYYSINAHYFAKGSWPNIKEIRLSITYNSQGRKTKVETDKEE